jgi:hypothetical protein
VTAVAVQAPTPFGQIMRRAVEATPGAVGGAFAAADGELVDSYATWDPEMWAILTAHYGIILHHLRLAFGTWHYGGPEYFIVQHERLDVVVSLVDAGYYALMAVEGPCALGHTLAAMRDAVKLLQREMA